MPASDNGSLTAELSQRDHPLNCGRQGCPSKPFESCDNRLETEWIIFSILPMVLPGVLHTEHMEEKVQIRPEFVGVSKGDLPQELIKDCVRELWIFPTAELEQPSCVLCCVRFLYQLLQVTIPGLMESKDCPTLLILMMYTSGREGQQLEAEVA